MIRKFIIFAMLTVSAISSMAITISPSTELKIERFDIIPSGSGEIKGVYYDDIIDYPSKVELSVYDENFQLVKKFIPSSFPCYIDFQPSCGGDYGEFLITKGLFSDDFNYVLKTENGLGIYDLNQNLISTIPSPAGYTLFGDLNYLVMGDKKYLLVYAETTTENRAYIVYQIDNNSRINQVAINPLKKISPRTPRQGEYVNISFDEIDMDEEHLISVYSIDGKILLQQTSAAGESEVQISTANLPQGIYTIAVNGVSGRSESTKIIVH